MDEIVPGDGGAGGPTAVRDGGEAGASSASTTSCGEPQPKKSMAPANAPGSVAGLFDRDGARPRRRS